MAERTDQIEQEAADFVVRVHADDAAEADWLALEAWIAQGPDHQAAYDRAEALWFEVGEIGDGIAPLLAPDEVGSNVRTLQPRPTRRAALGWAAAAAAAVAVTVGGGFYATRPLTETYATRAGETREIALSDGSRLVLNGATRVSVRMARSERRVILHDGEASFDVAHNAERPFLIDVGERQVRVVGTEFNIGRRAGQTTVTVRRGVVEVRPAKGQGAPARLNAGTELVAADGAAAKVSKVNADNAFAWRSGRLVYNDRPMADVAADLSRRFPTPVTVDASAANIRFTGVLVLDDETAVLRRLEGLAPVTAQRGATTITLRRAPN